LDKPIDKRGVLDDLVFSYKATKDKKVFISYHNRHVTTLRGSNAEHFLLAMENSDGLEAQLLMAKATGNFKHGNER